MKIGRSFWIILFLAGANALAGLLVGDPIVYRGLYFWILILVFSYIWGNFSINGIQVERHIREERVEFGQYIFETITVINDSTLPKIWLELQDMSDFSSAVASRVITHMGRKTRQSFSAITAANKRGIYGLGPTRVFASDIFGIFYVEKILPVKKTLLVTPLVIEVQKPTRAYGYITGGKPTRKRIAEETVYPSSVREYQPGDPLKRIHWPSTARTNRFMVKEYDFNPQTSVVFFINASSQIHWQEKTHHKRQHPWVLENRNEKHLPKSSMDYLATIAASLARYYIHQGLMVGLYSNDRMGISLTPDRNERQYLRILESLAMIQGDGEVDFYGLVASQQKFIPSRSQIWLLSTSQDTHLKNTAEKMHGFSFLSSIVSIYPEDTEYNQIIQHSTLFQKLGGQYHGIPADGSISRLISEMQSISGRKN